MMGKNGGILSNVYKLDAENELRFVIEDENSKPSLKLLSGFAEIFGFELEKDVTYAFQPPASIVLFTWQGCSVEFYGSAKSIYVEKKSLMIIPTYMHACLEEKRLRAQETRTKGCVSLVVGGRGVGKSTFCKILLNYAARLGRRPLFVDLDVNQNSVCLPGTMSILPVEKPCSASEGFETKDIIVYPFGYTKPQRNLPLYLLLIKELGKKLKSQLEKASRNTQASGVIIDTCGCAWNRKFQTNKFIIRELKVDVVFVIGSRTLYKRLKNYGIDTAVFVPEQEVFLEQSVKFLSNIRDNRIQNYFFGINKELNPHTFDLSFDEFEVYKLSPASKNIDFKNISFDDIVIIKVPNYDYAQDLIDNYLCVSYADVADKSLITTNVAGFIYVKHVCLTRKIITVMSPQPYPLPSKILLMGNDKQKE